MAEDVLRQRTKVAAHKKVTADKLEEMMEKVFDGTMQVNCMHCRRNTPVPMPSLKDLRELIVALEGNVPEAPQTVNHNVNVLMMGVDERATYLEQLRQRRESLALTSGDESV